LCYILSAANPSSFARFLQWWVTQVFLLLIEVWNSFLLGKLWRQYIVHAFISSCAIYQHTKTDGSWYPSLLQLTACRVRLPCGPRSHVGWGCYVGPGSFAQRAHGDPYRIASHLRRDPVLGVADTASWKWENGTKEEPGALQLCPRVKLWMHDKC
jgi:hypothetical protein